MPKEADHRHPFDTPVSSGFRFLTEIIAWIAGPWAASQIHILLAVAVLVVLIGLPTIFTTKGDKKHMVIDTPGPGRVAVELIQYLVAAVAPWLVWPSAISAVCGLVVIAALVLGYPRLRWLMSGAPLDDEVSR